MDKVKDKIKKNWNKYRPKKRKFHGNRYTKKNSHSPITDSVDTGIDKTDSQIDFRLGESTSHSATNTSIISVSTQGTLQNCQSLDQKVIINNGNPKSFTVSYHFQKLIESKSGPIAVASSSFLPVSILTKEKKQVTRKRKNVSNGPLQVPITSFSEDNVVQQPTPKRAKPTAKKNSDTGTQDVARSILTSIIKNKKRCLPNQSSTDQRQSAQISKANNGRLRASKQTETLTSFHHNVHKLMILMTDTDPGNVEDIEEVVASVLDQHVQLDS